MKNDITLGQNPDMTSTDASTGGCCGGACACGHGGQESAAAADARATGVVTEVGVTGMTCGHCVSSVTEELGELAGVSGVDVTLVAGGVSTVRVTSSAPLDPDAVRAAVDEAGYELA